MEHHHSKKYHRWEFSFASQIEYYPLIRLLLKEHWKYYK